MVDEAAKTGALHVSTRRDRVARARVRAAHAARHQHPARSHRRPAPRREPGANPPLPPRGAPLAHPHLRRFARRHRRLREREGHRLASPGTASSSSCGDLLRPVKFFPETTPAIEVLRFMRRERQRLVVAVDEDGVVTGLATFEDLVEELVGDISSEDDEERQAIVHELDGSAIVRGDVPLREVNRALELALPEAPGVTTIGGLCVKLGGGIPHRDARLAAQDGTVLVVLDASARAVRRVRVIRPHPPAPAAHEDEATLLSPNCRGAPQTRSARMVLPRDPQRNPPQAVPMCAHCTKAALRGAGGWDGIGDGHGPGIFRWRHAQPRQLLAPREPGGNEGSRPGRAPRFDARPRQSGVDRGRLARAARPLPAGRLPAPRGRRARPRGAAIPRRPTGSCSRTAGSRRGCSAASWDRSSTAWPSTRA